MIQLHVNCSHIWGCIHALPFGITHQPDRMQGASFSDQMSTMHQYNQQRAAITSQTRSVPITCVAGGQSCHVSAQGSVSMTQKGACVCIPHQLRSDRSRVISILIMEPVLFREISFQIASKPSDRVISVPPYFSGRLRLLRALANTCCEVQQRTDVAELMSGRIRFDPAMIGFDQVGQARDQIFAHVFRFL